MTEQSISELKAGQIIEGLFAVGDIASAKSKKDKIYLRLKLFDRTGSMEARVWDEELAIRCQQEFSEGSIILLKGNIDEYNGKMQMIIQDYSIPEEVLDPARFLPCSPKSRDEMLKEFQVLLGLVKDEYLKQLLLNVFSGERLKEFCQAPAARIVHHAYLGGLLEHSVEVARICRVFVYFYPQELNADLLISGALLHDIGKIEEYICRPGFPLTDRSLLVGGHIVLGRDIVRKEISAIEAFPLKTALAVEHMLISHHGLKEWGALEEPMTVEAVALSQADLASARINQAACTVREGVEEEWTGYNNLLRRRLWVPDIEKI